MNCRPWCASGLFNSGDDLASDYSGLVHNKFCLKMEDDDASFAPSMYPDQTLDTDIQTYRKRLNQLTL